jgi:2-keto-3-deoxy-L-rhamnonate aldolase RhmA
VIPSALSVRLLAAAGLDYVVHRPPAGHRSVGGVLAAAEPFCLVMAESAAAVADLDDILATDGVDGLTSAPGTCR